MNCQQCIHGRSSYGHHLSCGHPNAMISIMIPQDIQVSLNPHGVANGWCLWPFNFDPIWVDECNSFKDKNDHSLQSK